LPPLPVPLPLPGVPLPPPIDVPISPEQPTAAAANASVVKLQRAITDAVPRNAERSIMEDLQLSLNGGRDLADYQVGLGCRHARSPKPPRENYS
jgi:hypothetical protein